METRRRTDTSDTAPEEFFAAVRREILSLLSEGGAVTLPEIPREWPVTRLHLRYALMELVEMGLVESGPPGRVPGQPSYTITERGARIVASNSRDVGATAA